MTDTNNSWIEKYRPNDVSDIICNKKAAKSICDWLKSFEENKKKIHTNVVTVEKKRARKDSIKKVTGKCKSCLLITGNHGVGKSITTEVILKAFKYSIQTVNFNSIKGNKISKDYIKKLMKSTNIMNVMNENVNNKSAILIDEIEAITSTTEKSAILNLQKLNEIHWYCPIIFISNNQHNKLLSEIKKNSEEIKFYHPFPSDMKKIMFNIAQKEAIQIKGEDVIDKILLHAQSDIRRLIYTLQDIKYAFKNKMITNEVIDEYCNMSKKKDVDIDLFKATEGLLYDYTSINDCLRYYETEKVLLPLMVHQNYPKCVLNNQSKAERYDIINKVSESLSYGDVVENYIYGDQNWDLQEIHGFHTCVATSFYLNDSQNMRSIVKRPLLKFSTDLNKTSIKKINKKNINNTSKCFKDMNIFDYIYINKIIRKLIDNDQIEECVKLLEGYDVKIEHIESLLKIDKIDKNDSLSTTSIASVTNAGDSGLSELSEFTEDIEKKTSKVNLTSKQKKEFLKYLKN